MNEVLKKFGEAKGIKLLDNEESITLYRDELIEPKLTTETCVVTSVTTDDCENSVSLVTDEHGENLSITIINIDNGTRKTYDPNTFEEV